MSSFAAARNGKQRVGAVPQMVLRTIHNQRIADMLTQPLYAGYIEAPKWDIGLRRGRHEPLISFETYDKIQQRLKD